MSIPRFTIKSNSIKAGVAVLSREESHHALSVLRLKRGDAVELLDGHGQHLRGVAAGTENGVLTVAIDQNQKNAAKSSPRPVITLAAAVIKPDKMDILIQKACELGVSRIAPLLCERGVVRLTGERWAGKVARWRRIADGSCKQCGRGEAPQIDAPRRFKDFLETESASHDLMLFPTLAAQGKSLSEALSEREASSVLVFIGPEGDFSQKETGEALSKGVTPVTLGPLILRSETAALYALSCVQYHYGMTHEN